MNKNIKTYADTYQDAFVLKLFKNPGYYVDIGCSDGVNKSNSLLLEENNWDGILTDYNCQLVESCKLSRKSKNIYCLDSTNGEKIVEMLKASNCPNNIDYISLDIDHGSLKCLQNFPLNDYKFKFMTFEHDLYAGRQETIDRKNITPIFLEKCGYSRLIDNILIHPQGPYEDWYISNQYTEIINIFKDKKNIYAEEAYQILEDSKLQIS